MVHDLLISVNYRMISPFREDFIFTQLRICEVSRNKTFAKISESTVFDIRHLKFECGIMFDIRHLKLECWIQFYIRYSTFDLNVGLSLIFDIRHSI